MGYVFHGRTRRHALTVLCIQLHNLRTLWLGRVILLRTPTSLFCQSPQFSFLVQVELTNVASLANSNPSILVQPIAIIAIEQNYDCSKTITQQQSSQPASTGYTIQLANPLNNTDVRSFSVLACSLLMLTLVS